MIETATFVCSICNEPSLDICVRCTKDACPNHRCARCKACSDCCECEVPLTEPEPEPRERTKVAETNAVPNEPDVFLLPPEASEEPDLNVPRSEPASDEDAMAQPPDDHKPPGT